MKVPSTMATQHPDNSDKYVGIQQEPQEAIQALKNQNDNGFGIEEILIDFEGKLTPYHQTSQIALGLIEEGKIPGIDVAITPRIPNATKEPIFRQLMSIMSLVETNALSYKRTSSQAILETIVPMIESGKEMINIQDRINSVIELGNKNYDVQFPLNSIEIIPLVESVPGLVNINRIIDEYYIHNLKTGNKINKMRVMLARSDSAMSFGMASSVLSIKIALSRLKQWGIENGVEIYPILGCGSLPFRGNLNLDSLDKVLETYNGVKTYTIQSGLRYDHSKSDVDKLVNTIKERVDTYNGVIIPEEELQIIKEFIGIFSKHYVETFTKLISTVDFISKFIPKNRDRLASVKQGLQYVREAIDVSEIADLVSDVKLKQEIMSLKTDIDSSIPRAISFTAAMYTIGLPPEVLGMGRGLKEISDKYGDAGISLIMKHYPQLKWDLECAMKYTNIKVSKNILPEEARREYEEDFLLSASILNLNIEEENEDEFYQTLLKTSRPLILHLIGTQEDMLDDINEEVKILGEWVVKMGKMRGSLG